MTLDTLIKCLKALRKSHPELKDEEVKAYMWQGRRSNIYYEVGSVNWMTNDLKCVIELDERPKNLDLTRKRV